MKFGGIKELYPRVPLDVKIKAYIALVRPFTLVAPAIAGIIGTILPLLYAGQSVLNAVIGNIHIIIYVSATLMIAQAVGQIINQCTDLEIDKINKPYRPIPRGLVSKSEAFSLAIILMLLAIFRAFLTSVVFGFFILVVLFFAVFYSLEPIRVKKRNHWLALFWMSFSRGFLPFIATWCVFGSLSDLTPYVFGTIAFFWCLAFQSTKDFPDYEGDKKFNIPTIVTVYGPRKAVEVMIALFAVYLYVVGVISFIYSPLFIVLALISFCFGFIILTSYEKSVDYLENTISWMMYYLGLGFVYVFALALTIL